MFYGFCTVHYVLQLLAVFQLQNAFVYGFFSLSGLFFFGLIDFFQFRWVFVPARGLSAVARKEGLLFIAVRDILITVASLCRAQTRGAWTPVVVAQGLELFCGLWILPRPGMEPVSPHWQTDSDLLYHRRSPAWIVLTSILCKTDSFSA